MNKELSAVEVLRVAHLQAVWEYLYGQKIYRLCDYISQEIGIIKGTITDAEILESEV
jgi:hypothetical protein